jgi:hypothetical protein
VYVRACDIVVRMHDAGACSDAFVHSACMFGCKVMGVSVYLVAITSFDRDMTVFRRYKNREKSKRVKREKNSQNMLCTGFLDEKTELVL